VERESLEAKAATSLSPMNQRATASLEQKYKDTPFPTHTPPTTHKPHHSSATMMFQSLARGTLLRRSLAATSALATPQTTRSAAVAASTTTRAMGTVTYSPPAVKIGKPAPDFTAVRVLGGVRFDGWQGQNDGGRRQVFTLPPSRLRGNGAGTLFPKRCFSCPNIFVVFLPLLSLQLAKKNFIPQSLGCGRGR
jgi:hypothetical protein